MDLSYDYYLLSCQLNFLGSFESGVWQKLLLAGQFDIERYFIKEDIDPATTRSTTHKIKHLKIPEVWPSFGIPQRVKKRLHCQHTLWTSCHPYFDASNFNSTISVRSELEITDQPLTCLYFLSISPTYFVMGSRLWIHPETFLYPFDPTPSSSRDSGRLISFKSSDRGKKM